MAAAFAVPLPKSSQLASRELSSAFLSCSPLKGLCIQTKSRRSKNRSELSLMVSAAAGAGEGRFYFNFTGFPFPLGPFLNRQTLRYEVSAVCADPFKNFNWSYTNKRRSSFP